MNRRIAFYNEKGGVSKTTTTYHVSAAIAQMGYRVLVCDLDPRGDISHAYLGDDTPITLSMADIFAAISAPTSKLIYPTKYQNLFMIPTDPRLRLHDTTHDYHNHPAALLLAHALSEVRDQFDFTFFDCPASGGHLTSFGALIAADEVLIPVEPSRFSIRGVLLLSDEIRHAQQRFNQKLKVRYYFSRIKPRSPMHRTCRDMLTQQLGPEPILNATIPELDALNTATNYRVPVTIRSPRSKAAEVIRLFAKELVGVDYERHASPKLAA